MRGDKAAGGEISSLTGLRGCAAVFVMLYHFVGDMPAGTVPFSRLFGSGYLCVDLFFILSGFVLAYAHAKQFAGRLNLRMHARFLVARIARIYPLFLLVTLETAGAAVWRTGHVDVRALGWNLLMVQGWGIATSLEGASWSVSTEWCAYLAFPLLLAIAMVTSRCAAIIAAAACLVALAAIAWLPVRLAFPWQGRSGLLDIYSAATLAPLVRCVAEFTLGLLAFRLARHLWGMNPTQAARWTALVASALVVAFTCGGLDLAVVPLFCALLILLPIGNGLLPRMLGSAVPHRLGRWSYSIYLLHDKFSRFAVRLQHVLAHRTALAPLASVISIAAASMLAIGCAAVVCSTFEQPLRRRIIAMLPGRPGLTGEPAALIQPAGG